MSRVANERPLVEIQNCPVVGTNAELVILVTVGESNVKTFVTEPR